MRKLFAAVVVLVGAVGFLGSPSASAAGPNQEVFESNPAFLCEGAAGLPPSHCINAKGQGDTGVILVFEPDPRGPQEGVSTNPKSDSRPCPHDPGADADGTWWSPLPGLWVCHHKP